MTAPTHIQIAGLQVPVELAPRIIAAFRGTYPTITEGKDDDAAVRAVLKHLVAAIMSNHEARLALLPAEDEVEQVRGQYRDQAEQARQQALAAADTIVEAPPTV